MAERVEFAKENYIKKFIGSLYTERPQNIFAMYIK